MLAAVLDGATPLHCAALRTSPKLTEHLLASGADPMARTAAGDLPMDLVPPCLPKPVSARSKGALPTKQRPLMHCDVDCSSFLSISQVGCIWLCSGQTCSPAWNLFQLEHIKHLSQDILPLGIEMRSDCKSGYAWGSCHAICSMVLGFSVDSVVWAPSNVYTK